MTGALLSVLLAAALEGTHLVASVPITTTVDGAAERAELRWVIRRDENERGVVPHDSGWMQYGSTPWLNHHLAVVTTRGGAPSVRWMSSAVELDGLFVEDGDVVLRSKGTLTRYVFRGWRLERSDRPPLPSLTKARLAQRFDTGLLHLAAVGDVMVGRATAKALDVIGVEAAFSAVKPVLARADVRLGNLESCFSRAPHATPGAIDLTAPVRRLDALTALGFDALSLANNHCDAADAALSRDLLRDAGVVGVMDEPVRLGDVAVLGVKLWPTSSALLDEALGEKLRQARALASNVIVLVHWGDEYAQTPSPAQREAAAWLLSHGATVVLGAHPHVLQPVEQPGPNTLVAYSLGNFVFDQQGYPTGVGSKTEETVVLEVRVHRTLGLTWRTTPFRIAARARLEPR